MRSANPISPSGSGAAAAARLRRSTSGAANIKKQTDSLKSFDNGETLLRLKEGERWIARPKSEVGTPREGGDAKRHLELSPIESALSASGNSVPTMVLPMSASISTSSITGSGSCSSSGESSPRSTPVLSTSFCSSQGCSSPVRSSGRKVSFCGVAPPLIRRAPSAEPPKIKIVQTPNAMHSFLLRKIHGAVPQNVKA